MADLDHRLLDHFYHRSRVDAHITGNIVLVVLVAALALTAGGKFKPFRYGAEWFEPVRLVWVEGSAGSEDNGEWVLERTLRQTNNLPPAGNKAPIAIQEVYPISLSLILAIGIVMSAYFIYRCARRQTQLMVSTCAGDPDRPYDRAWEEIRVTFWALDVVLAFILLFFFLV